jgi:hypothetical protein
VDALHPIQEDAAKPAVPPAHIYSCAQSEKLILNASAGGTFEPIGSEIELFFQRKTQLNVPPGIAGSVRDYVGLRGKDGLVGVLDENVIHPRRSDAFGI